MVKASGTSDMACPGCGAGGLSAFYELDGVPVHSCVLSPTRKKALAFPRGDLSLAHCAACGFITNTRFDPAAVSYSADYEDQQCYSPTFNRFARELAERLVERYALHGKHVVEIGCGKADFLGLLCELGGNRGTGIDPSADPGRLAVPAAARIELVRENLAEEHARFPADLVVCRHTLEHVADAGRFLRLLRHVIGERAGTPVFFEIPDAMRILRDAAFEDIYYEHCTYLTPGTLARLFRGSGFEVVDLQLAYGDQYLLIEARAAEGPVTEIVQRLEETRGETAAAVSRFTDDVAARRAGWIRRLDELAGERVAIWGSGSKCVAFLSTLDCAARIGCVVDINPRRHGRFLPGHGIEIRPPEYLAHYRPERVIVMNALYADEIREQLKRLQLDPPLLTL